MNTQNPSHGTPLPQKFRTAQGLATHIRSTFTQICSILCAPCPERLIITLVSSICSNDRVNVIAIIIFACRQGIVHVPFLLVLSTSTFSGVALKLVLALPSDGLQIWASGGYICTIPNRHSLFVFSHRACGVYVYRLARERLLKP